MNSAVLVLEDGRTFWGRRFGAAKETGGEVVFNTAMCGYQEVLGDPSYAHQIVVMTYPMQGNYGLAPEDFESANNALESARGQGGQSYSFFLASNQQPR